jgi:hypothetical protein
MAAAGLALSLVVFLAGAGAAAAAGTDPPTAFWAAGGAVSGALVGLLAPSPAKKPSLSSALDQIRKTEAQLQLVADVPEKAATQRALATARQQLFDAVPTAHAALQEAEHQLSQLQTRHDNVHAQSAKTALGKAKSNILPSSGLSAGGIVGILMLGAVFVLLLALAVVLASGGITPPKGFKTNPLPELIKAVITLASAAGTGLISVFAPSPAQSSGGSPQ